MLLRSAWQVGMCASTVASVAFFATCGDDGGGKETCPYAMCQYSGDNLVDCTGANEEEVCATNFYCLADDGSGPVGDAELGICARSASNTAMTTRIELRLPVEWTLRRA